MFSYSINIRKRASNLNSQISFIFDEFYLDTQNTRFWLYVSMFSTEDYKQLFISKFKRNTLTWLNWLYQLSIQCCLTETVESKKPYSLPKLPNICALSPSEYKFFLYN